MKRFALFLSLIALIVGLLPTAALATTTSADVTLALSSASVGVDDTFTLTVSATGTDVYGSAVDLIVNSGALLLTSSTAGDLVTTDAIAGQTYTTTLATDLANSGKRHTAIALRLGTEQDGRTGTGVIGTFTFQAKVAGAYTFGTTEGTVAVQLVDASGQLLALDSVSSVTLNVGEAAPEITSPADSEPTYINGHTAVISGDAPAGTVLTPVINSSPDTTNQVTADADDHFSATLNLPSDGSYSVLVRDASDTESNTVTFVVDTLKPTITLDDLTPASDMTVSGTVSDANRSGVAYVQLNPTGAPTEADLVDLLADGSFDKSLTALTGGATYILRVTATDKAGNTKVLEQSFTVPVTPGLPTLELIPSKTTVQVGEMFNVKIMVRNATTVAGVDVKVPFPTDLLKVVDPLGEDSTTIVAGNVYKYSGQNSVDPVNGVIWYAGAADTLPTTDTVAATIFFKALSGGTVNLQFGDTTVKDQTKPVPLLMQHNKVGTTFTVASSTVTGVVLTARPGAVVKVVGQSISADVAADGSFTLTNVPAGSQQLLIRFKNPNDTGPAYSLYLAKLVTVDVAAGMETDAGTITLKGGDVTGDNWVELGDLILLADAYGHTPDDGTTRYNNNADFNNDGIVELGDLIILADSYGELGAEIPAGE